VFSSLQFFDYNLLCVRFQVLTAVSMKVAVFWPVVQCSLVEVYRRFRGPCCPHHQGDDGGRSLMMEAASTFETSVNFYQTTRRNNPEDSHNQFCMRLSSPACLLHPTPILFSLTRSREEYLHLPHLIK
jgi:hypothetical protein